MTGTWSLMIIRRVREDKSPGSKQSLHFLDFFIIKATGMLTDDMLLLIFQVKKNSKSIALSYLQMAGYIFGQWLKNRDAEVRFQTGTENQNHLNQTLVVVWFWFGSGLTHVGLVLVLS